MLKRLRIKSSLANGLQAVLTVVFAHTVITSSALEHIEKLLRKASQIFPIDVGPS